MPSIDLFIPVAPKDYIKLPFVLRSVAAYLPEIQAVHVCAPTDAAQVFGPYRFPVYYHPDQAVLPFDLSRFKFRPTWVYQQFLKLFQPVTAGEWYLVMDADKIINHALPLFDGDQPILYLPERDQDHGPYYEYSQKMIGLRREYNHSFLSEFTLYNRQGIEAMLARAGLTQTEWLDKSAEIINAECCIGDAELYGNFMAVYAPDLYKYRIIRDEMRGSYNGDWSEEVLTSYVDEMRAYPEVDTISAHSWHD